MARRKGTFSTSKKLRRISSHIADFNVQFSDEIYNGRIPKVLRGDEIAYSKDTTQLLRKISRLEAATSVIKPSSEFERLAIQSALDGLHAQEQFVRFFLRGEGTVDELVENILGENTIDQHKTYLHNAIRNNQQPPPSDFDINEMGEDQTRLLDRLSQLIVSNAIAESLLPPDARKASSQRVIKWLTFNINIDPDGEGAGYHEESTREEGAVDLSNYHFRRYTRAGKTIINPGTALVVLAHEMYGHGLAHVFSEGMPPHLDGTTPNVDSLAALGPSEGMALWREGLTDTVDKRARSLGFFGKRLVTQKRLGYSEEELLEIDDVKKEEIDYALRTNKVNNNSLALDAFIRYLFLKHDTQADVQRELNELYPDQSKPSTLLDRPQNAHELIYKLSYVAGLCLVEQCVANIVARYEEEHGNDTREAIEGDLFTLNAILSTGRWSQQTFPDWITFALDNQDAFETEYLTPLFRED
jgi:hypothetical protein